ncbi:MAG: proline--tRNA ligase [Malacoplasma sp.]
MKIVSKNIDFSKWYTSVLQASGMFEYGMIKGTIIMKPYSYAIWENIQKHVNVFLRETNTQNCMMPLFIPYSEFIKETSHINGFSPELFKVTEIGSKKIEDAYVVRPTSEISFCNYFSSLLISYKDLPIKLNQWCSAFRAEKNTRPFLRTTEFLWQEQHAIFSNKKEAMDFSLLMIQNYKFLLKDILCIDCLLGTKTEYERFAGADITYTVESFMPDGQVLQSGTSHYLAQNFSKIFNIKFQSEDNKMENVYQTSAGISTRLIGAIVLAHSDDKGLVLPSKIAPYSVVLNIFNHSNEMENNLIQIKKILANFSHHIDDSDKSFGAKINEYEIKGVPIQIIYGEKEFKNEELTIYMRHSQERKIIKLKDFNSNYLNDIIKFHDEFLFLNSSKLLNSSIVEVNNIDEFTKAIKDKKIVLANWAGSKEDEEELKKLTGASSRCIKFNSPISQDSTCFFTKKSNTKKVYFARAY